MSRVFSNIVVVFTLLLFVFTVPVQAQSGCSANVSVDQGTKALDAGQYEEAITAFSCVIDADVSNAGAYLGRSQAYILNGDWLLALGDYRSLSLYHKTLRPYWELLAVRYDHLIETDATNPTGYILRAYSYWYSDQDSIALKDDEKILQLDPSNLFGLTLRGSSRLALNIQGYEEDWARALELSPDNPNVLGVIATTYRYTGDKDKALEYANRTLKIAPEWGMGYMMRGRVYLESQEYLKAVDDFNRAIELGLPPTRAVDSLGFMCEAYLYMNRPKDAAVSYERAKQIMPNAAWAGYSFGVAYTDMSYPEEAARAFMEYATHINTKQLEGNALKIDEWASVSLNFGGWTLYSLPVELKKGQVVHFEANGADKVEIDPLIILVNPEHQAVAANDNPPDSSSLNAVIDEFAVPNDGLYTLLVTNTVDSSAGSVEVRFTEASD